jgi:tetratricopeptide (TPR) repeat protein
VHFSRVLHCLPSLDRRRRKENRPRFACQAPRLWITHRALNEQNEINKSNSTLRCSIGLRASRARKRTHHRRDRHRPTDGDEPRRGCGRSAKGDIATAKRNVDAALNADPKLWPAFYMRAQIFAAQGKYQLAIQDCNEALRLYPGFVEVALLRAKINARLGKYAEALKEFNYLVSIRPRSVTFARALSDRAWFRATCPDSSFRNGQQAVKDAKAACSIMEWKDESMIDTLAAAYAETGDFDSAMRYTSQALAVKGISSDDAKLFREHLALFQQRKRFPVSK